MINISSQNLNFKSRNITVRNADKICRMVKNEFPAISTSKLNIKINTDKKYAKFYHPDSLGRELFPEEEIIYSLLVQGRNEMCEMIALADEVFGK